MDFRAIYPDGVIVADGNGAIVISKTVVDALVQPALEQEELDAWILSEVVNGAALSGLYPPDPENITRYQATKAWRKLNALHAYRGADFNDCAFCRKAA